MSESTQTTLVTAAGTTESPDRYSCPGVHQVDGLEGGERIVIGKTGLPAAAARAVAGLVAADETAVRVPSWVACELMDLSTLGAFIEAHLHRRGDVVFRMERLPAYDVDEPLYDLWRAGADLDWSLKADWLDVLREHREQGITHQRVRILPAELTDYQLYSCEWGYALNSEAGEEIRVLWEGEHPVPEGLIEVEYWLVNNAIALPTLYDGRGRFLGAGWLSPGRSGEYLDDRDRAWAAAEPFGRWWARHPELHRSARKAA